MDSLYVIGGRQRQQRALLEGDGYWYAYQQGVIVRVSPERSTGEVCVEYVSRPDACGPDDPVLFKSGTLRGDRLYVCTQTEVLIYALPHFEQVGYLSLPCFNDVHHVLPTPDGTLLIANSGLEMVLEATLEGEVLREWNTLGEDPWERFSRTTDYRKGINTKPHRSHPNYLFNVGDEIWATRFHQMDALCLNRPDRRIEIGIERVHDGVLHNGFLHFTTVNGRVVIANPQTLVIEEVIDLNELHDDLQLGWCRSLLFDGNQVWIGFSRIRPTKFRENVSWLVRGFKRAGPTRIACYDLAAKRCLTEVDVEPYGLNAVFGIYPDVGEAPMTSQHTIEG